MGHSNQKSPPNFFFPINIFFGLVLKNIHCDSCTMHRSSVTPRTPEGAHECSASRGSSSSSMITLDDVMQQLKQSSGVMDAKLGLIH